MDVVPLVVLIVRCVVTRKHKQMVGIFLSDFGVKRRFYDLVRV